MKNLASVAAVVMAGLGAVGVQAQAHTLAVPVDVSDIVRPRIELPPIAPELALRIHRGDVLLRTQADADRVCVSVIIGDLTVQPDPGDVISLPCLLQIQGDLNLRLPAAQHITADEAPSCAGGACSDVAAGRVDASGLTHVTGHVRVAALNVSRPDDSLDEYVLFDVGLPALNRVGGNVEVANQVPFSILRGMPVLEELHGDVVFAATAYTGNASALMPRVRTVTGDVVVDGDVYNLLAGLESAGKLVLRDHYETLVDTWNDVAFGGLELDGVTHYYELIADMIALQPGAALLVTADQAPGAVDVCGLIEREAAAGWEPLVWGFDASACSR